jgi:cell shape-determining protein MreD
MNRALSIVLIPAVFVAVGYVFVLEFVLGTPGAYWRLIVPFALVGGALWWFGREARKRSSGAQ